MRGAELDAKIAVALDLDSIRGMRADSTTAGRQAREAMGIIFQEDQATSDLVGSGEGPSLPFHAPSFGGDSDSPFKEVRSSSLCVGAE